MLPLPSRDLTRVRHQASLLGGEPDHDAAVYDRSVQSGSTVVTVKVPDHHVDRVMQILDTHNPIDIDERATTWPDLNDNGPAGKTKLWAANHAKL